MGIMLPCKWMYLLAEELDTTVQNILSLLVENNFWSSYTYNYTNGHYFFPGPYPNITITLEFKEFITECSYDYLFIHDGDSYLSPLIGAISGKNSVQTVVAHSGQVTVVLKIKMEIGNPMWKG